MVAPLAFPKTVSIHAPTRGATAGQAGPAVPWRFQSTPPRGGRPSWPLLVSFGSEFQSTPPRGGRHLSDAITLRREGVSIHAPTRGATSTIPTATTRTPCFNPRPHAGGDLTVLIAPGHTFVQSTPPRGGRPPASSHSASSRKGFNPRPHAGGDGGPSREAEHPEVSIHAPTRGATRHDAEIVFDMTKFQSTPPRGGRPARSSVRSPVQGVSIHAPTRGATRPDPSSPPRGAFQSTPPRGGRRRRPEAREGADSCFNPRPHAGGDWRPG